MKTYGQLNEEEQEQFTNDLLVLTKNGVEEILGAKYPLYDKLPFQILSDIKKVKWAISPNKLKHYDWIVARSIKLSWDYKGETA
jgi:lipocalin|tara:strand:+ start:999 stop:1250 length:252 start_codon:yes stop_codon:yes gene_type:complete